MSTPPSSAGQSPDTPDVAAIFGTAAQGAEEASFLSCAESLRELAAVADRRPEFADAVRAALAAPGVDTAAPTVEAVARTLDELAQPDTRHGKWILAKLARDLRAALAARTPQPPDELDRLRTQDLAVRALVEKAVGNPAPPRRWLGWSVVRPDESSSFGCFDRHESAERCLASVQRGACPNARIVESYVQDPADTRVDALAVLAVLDAAPQAAEPT